MTPLPSLKQLHYLVAVATHLNFTRAAESCFVTQSTLSAGLRELDATLGARLVERNRQSVLMTPLGEEIARRARALLTEAEDLVRIATEASESLHRTVRLGIIPTIAPFLLPGLLAQVSARYPGLQLLLREDRTAELLQRLDDGRLDFALMALPYDTGQRRVETLFEDPLWLLGRAGDPALNSPETSADEILQKLLLLEEGHCLREHSLSACGRKEKASSDIEATSLLTLVQMVESGLGYGLLPEMAVRCGVARSPKLALRPFSGGHPGRTIALVTRATSPHPAEFSALAELLRALHASETPTVTTAA